MSKIKITTQVLKDTAKEVRSLNTKLNDDLDACNKAMNDLEDKYQSDAATDIRAAMNALRPRFNEYQGVIESYAKFLDETAVSYETTEQAVQSNAAQFKQA